MKRRRGIIIQGKKKPNQTESKELDLQTITKAKTDITPIMKKHLHQKVTEALQQHSLKEDKTPSIPHNQKNKCFAFSYSIVSNAWFNLLVILVITANIVILAMDRVNQPPKEVQITETLNSIFEVFFLLEMLIKLFGLGFKDYARDNYNLLDALLVIASLVNNILE